MGKKHTYEEVRCIITKLLGYELISKEYINNKGNIIMKDNHGYYYSSCLSDIQQGKQPSRFNKSNQYTIQNIELWCKLNGRHYKLISDTYINSDIKLKWRCLKKECGEIFEMDWGHIYGNRNCPFCAGQKVGLSNCLATLNPELAKEWHPTLNDELTPYDVTLSGKDSYWWICEFNNKHKWESTVYNRNNGSGCPYCNIYKGEKRCKEVFIYKGLAEIVQSTYNTLLNTNDNTYFISQKTFDGLLGIGNRLLSYDFYIPKYNLLIEYQGEYHDGTAKNQTSKGFEKQQEHDRRKRKYAKNNNIRLLEIWYWDFDKIEEILEMHLNNF